jgi:hypothetical protein
MSVLEEAGLVLREALTSDETRCFYCGLSADTVDHVIPRSALEILADDPDALRALADRRRRLTVVACRECNGLARATVQETLAERRTFVKERMRLRYAGVLATPSWTDAELMQLRSGLRKRVIVAMATKAIIERRLRWPS